MALRYDEDEILDQLRAWATEHGRSPSSKEWMAGPGRVSRDTVQRRFGSWTEGLRRAGLEPNRPGIGDVPTAVLAEAFDRSGLTLAEVARGIGYVSRGKGDSSAVRRLMGRAAVYDCGNTVRLRVTWDVAERFVLACGIDPVDVGL
jgi:hypothetical protein